MFLIHNLDGGLRGEDVDVEFELVELTAVQNNTKYSLINNSKCATGQNRQCQLSGRPQSIAQGRTMSAAGIPRPVDTV
jgi:hypothetical protein